ncbi:hypothetical protein [Halobacterium noricense]|uniref:hypothetical protein n=1 Tax=Halobacterium noricense TaxID=223182 RepID=UPI001E43EBB6|nr:hypothetical protein [Halobacterium noricense]UHH25279.1 hypothetical protein LT974_15055 [Halobacterium noricense]
MPSTRRRFLAAVGTTGIAGFAGCSAFDGGRPDVNTGSGLHADTSRALDDEAVYLAGDTSDLPDPPKTAEAVAGADVVLATPSADRADLTRALRADKPVAFAGGGAQAALRDLLEAARGEYTFGVEAVRARPVETVVAVPGGSGTVETYTCVAEGGWADPVLDPLGWALAGRVPECDTFVPEASTDDSFEYVGAANVVGCLETGEAYASRTAASAAETDVGRFVRLQTAVHASAGDGYAVEEAVREMDLPDDQNIDDLYPNGYAEDDVGVVNSSDNLRSQFEIVVTPASDRARSALTGCGGFRTEGAVGYDYRSSFQWKRDRLLGSNRHYASATGRGEWHLGG